jgi:hypothetical protein
MCKIEFVANLNGDGDSFCWTDFCGSEIWDIDLIFENRIYPEDIWSHFGLLPSGRYKFTIIVESVEDIE